MTKPTQKRARRVLVVTNYFSTHLGGIQLVAHQLVRHLSAQHPDWRFDWCASAGDALPDVAPAVRCHAMGCWNGIETRSGFPYPLWSPGAVLRLWHLVGRCDVAHLHDFAYMGNVIAALFCVLRGKPYVVTQHTGWVPYDSLAMRAILRTAIKTVGRAVLRNARRVIFVSDTVNDFFSGRMKLRAQTLANGVDTQMFVPVNAATRARLRRENGLDEVAPVAIFVGRFVERKGFPLILEMAARTPDVQWILMGSGPLDPGENVPFNVRVWRGRRGAQVAEVMQLADALVLPSQNEGFPLVVQEALACGTPVLFETNLAQSLPGVSAWLTTQALGTPDDAALWSARLRHALGARETQSQRQTRADWARQTWSWDVCARQYGELLEAVMREAHS